MTLLVLREGTVYAGLLAVWCHVTTFSHLQCVIYVRDLMSMLMVPRPDSWAYKTGGVFSYNSSISAERERSLW
jgi:hypothetical protein